MDKGGAVITRIDATNYRCFERLDVSLQGRAVIVGPNGAGKSTLLDIPILIADLLRSRNVAYAFIGRLLPRGPRATSLTELCFRPGSDSFTLAKLPVQIASSSPMTPAETHIRYELRLQIEGGRQLIVADERLFAFSAAEGSERLPRQAEDEEGRRTILRRSTAEGQESRLTLYPGHAGAQPQSSRIDRGILALPVLQYQSTADFRARRRGARPSTASGPKTAPLSTRARALRCLGGAACSTGRSRPGSGPSASPCRHI